MLLRTCTVSLVLVVLFGADGPAATPPVPGLLDVPIREVTVYSDRARVIRRGEVVPGKGPVRLALLPATLDPDSVRLTAEGAAVERVEVRRAGLGEFPRTEAEKLVRELEAARDAEGVLAERRAGLERERDLLFNLRPHSSPTSDPKAAPVLLEPTGWKQAVGFFDAREAALVEALRAVEAEQRAAQKTRQALSERAQVLIGAGGANPGWLVEAWLRGSGTAKVALTYLAAGARWRPAYDVRFDPGKAEVEVGFVALASQQTGEDWQDAQLTFSTAVPATTATLPKLTSWKIGDRDQFIPTPVARAQPPLPAAPQPDLETERSEDRDTRLRERLISLASGSGLALGSTGAGYGSGLGGLSGLGTTGRAGKGGSDYKAKRKAANRPAPPPPPPAPPAAMAKELRRAEPPPELPAEPEEVAEMDSDDFAGDIRPSSSMASAGPGGRSSMRAAGFGIGGPSGWRAPSYASDLPAALAGGYDFAYPSARPESIRSGGEERRVALHTARFPAAARLAIYPALRKSAYLVAEIVNTADRPLLRGAANVYVGADLQGQAALATTAVGEKITLPLGVDDAIQIERNVNVVTRETGVISKDDVTSYEVVLELMNPRRTAAQARVFDQVPLKGDKHVEVKLDRMEPWAIHDKDEGTLEWRLAIAPGAKQVIRFTYTVTRPRGAKLRQW